MIRARAWRIRTTAVEIDRPAPEPAAIPGPETASAQDFFPVPWDVGYHTAMEVRFVEGGFVDPGPARAWMRMRHPLVEGEAPDPLDRVLVAADSGNGVSAPLDYRRYIFINTDLTVNLRRLPAGEWVCLDAVTYPERSGIGLSDSALARRARDDRPRDSGAAGRRAARLSGDAALRSPRVPFDFT